MYASDYKILEVKNSITGSKRFKVMVGGKAITVKQTVADAEKVIRNLVKDPWFFDRGQTRKDRNG